MLRPSLYDPGVSIGTNYTSQNAVDRELRLFPFSRVEQADLTLVVVDCTHLPSDAKQIATFLQGHLSSVLPAQEQPETGKISWPHMLHLHCR